MEVLVLEGKNYVKASKAARDLGYATDYVGQLCRTGQVDAHLIGRTWYVNQDQLSTHRVEKKRMSRVKAREQAKKLIAVRREDIALRPKKTSNNIAISYEPDEAPLIPETRRLNIATEHTSSVIPGDDEISETIVENKGEKVRMSGDLKVVDVTDGPSNDDVTVLRPRIIRSQPSAQRQELSVAVPAVEETPEEAIADHEEQAEQPASNIRKSFIDRLEETTDSGDLEEEKDSALDKKEVVNVVESVEKYSFFIHTLFHVVILLGVLASFALSRVFVYDAGRIDTFEVTWSFSIADALVEFSERF